MFGRRDPVDATWVALANGMAAHSLELDDTFLPGSIRRGHSKQVSFGNVGLKLRRKRMDAQSVRSFL
jgi:hypothetical protein